MKRSFFILCLLLTVTVIVCGQHPRRPHSPREKPQPRERIYLYPEAGKFPLKPGWLLSTEVSTLWQPEGGPGLGAEYRFNLHWAVGLDATALLYSMPDTYNEHSPHRGFRVLPQVKYYFPGRKHSYRGYVSLQGMYKEVNYLMEEQIGREWNGNDYNYYESVEFKERKSVWAGSVNAGFQTLIGKQRRIMFEMFIGIGVRHKGFKQFGKPAQEVTFISIGERFFDFDQDGDYPHIPMGLKIGYRL